MIAYSIEAAIKCGCFDKVVVSTDDVEIADVAQIFGAHVPFIRPANIADDYATTLDVMKHAVELLESQGDAVNNVCCLYATAPFVMSSNLKEGYEVLQSGELDYAFSATSYAFPIQRALKLNTDDTVEMFQPEHFNTRSQDLIEAYHDAGQFYWGKAEAFKAKRPIFGAKSKAVLLPRKQVQDIDTPEDWELAEALFKVLNESCI